MCDSCMTMCHLQGARKLILKSMVEASDAWGQRWQGGRILSSMNQETRFGLVQLLSLYVRAHSACYCEAERPQICTCNVNIRASISVGCLLRAELRELGDFRRLLPLSAPNARQGNWSSGAEMCTYMSQTHIDCEVATKWEGFLFL